MMEAAPSTRIEKAALIWWRSLPVLRVTFAEMQALPEYSATNPSGMVPGKRWRRHHGAYDMAFLRWGGTPRWVICEYQDAPPGRVRGHDPEGKKPWVWKTVEMCKTVTWRPVITVQAPTREITCGSGGGGAAA